MEFRMITVAEYNKDHGTNWKLPHTEYKGENGYFIGVTPEIRLKDGTLDSESTTFICSIEDLNGDYWIWHRNDMSYKYEWTGRLVFRGYYSSHYDYEEREEYFIEENI